MKVLIDLKEQVAANIGLIKDSIPISGILSVLGVVMARIGEIFSVWWLESLDYFVIANFLVAFDHILGSVVHKWIKKDFCWKKNGIGLLIKSTMVLLAMFVFESISHLTKEQSFIYDYLKMTTRIIVCVYPAISILKNMSIVTGGRFPSKAMIDRFETVNEELDVTKFKKE